MVLETIRKGSSLVLTEKEIEVINKKLTGRKLNQQDSNYLSRYVRPKLKEIGAIDAKMLLDKLAYSQKSVSIEARVKRTILEEMKDIVAIILYGSAIQTNYQEYNDIDILVVTKNKIGTLGEKAKKIRELKEKLNAEAINSDIEIISKENLVKSYKNSPTLIYQLKDSKIIHGNIKIPDKIEIYNADLHMKLDWSDIEDIEPEGIDIYKALRNVVLVRLILNKIVDNKKLKESLNDEIGKNLIEKLKNNQESKIEKKLALNYLKALSELTRKEIKGGLWEKIEL